jgi:hypothetical protein
LEIFPARQDRRLENLASKEGDAVITQFEDAGFAVIMMAFIATVALVLWMSFR